MDISKSSYVTFLCCPKSLHFSLFHPELGKEKDATAKKRIADGIEVGNMAKRLFPNIIDVSSQEGVDKQKQIEATLEALRNDEAAIAEASFRHDRLYCACDIFTKKDGKYSIYEVKAATRIDETYYHDTAFQKYVLEQEGYHIDSVNLVLLNPSYVRHGEIEVKKLFQIIRIDTSKQFQLAYESIEGNLARFDETLEQAKVAVYRGNQCKGCPYFEECHKDLPHPNILELNGIVRGHDYLEKGIVRFEDAYQLKKWKKRQQVQIEAYLFDRDVSIDQPGVRRFLNSLSYPIYHLDFETMQLPIPPFDDTRPYQQIPFQYSLHIQPGPRQEALHKGYLGRTLDCRREIAESLCRDIPRGVTSMAYNSQFEKMVLGNLALLFPDLAPHLLDIRDHMVDLLIPFKSGAYYRKAMGGSNSIKAVLPACCPNDPELDYHALPVVHNGSEAMEIYPRLVQAPKEEQDRIYEGLWAYCRLDTLAMVKVLDKLYIDLEENDG